MNIVIQRIYKIIMSVLLIIPLIITSNAPSDKNTEIYVNENADNQYIKEYGNPDISAHRSGAGVAPQNTLMAFQKMLEGTEDFGVDTFEFDVQMTKDGEIILLHNLTYDDTSNAVEEFGKKNNYASAITYEDARKLNLGENFEIDGEYPYRGLRGDDIPDNLRVVKCEDVINYIESHSNGKKYNYIIEIKTLSVPGMQAADKLYKIINDCGIKDRTIWASFQPDVTIYMEQKYPDMPRSAGIMEVVEFYVYCRMGWDLNELDVSYVALQIPYGKSALDGKINFGTRQLINYAHKYNIAVQYWTINDADDVKALIDNGADCIMSDYPQIIFEAKNDFKNNKKLEFSDAF